MTKKKRTESLNNEQNKLHYINSFVTYLRHCKKRVALGIALDLRNYKAPAVSKTHNWHAVAKGSGASFHHEGRFGGHRKPGK
jgi:hypothetical protein